MSASPSAQTTAPAENDENTDNSGNGGGKHRAGMVLGLLLLLAAIAAMRFWLHSERYVSTDNAFIDGNVHLIAPRIAGTVHSVAVSDNQFVRSGDLLLEIDPADYAARQHEAAAELSQANNDIAADSAQVAAAKAKLASATTRLAQAEADLKRGSALQQRDVIPKEQLERLATARDVAYAQLQEAREEVRRSEAQLGLKSGASTARFAMKQARLEQATLQLAYTRIVAPADGYVTRKNVQVGNVLQPGQPLMAVVPLQTVWITANYKERQLAHVQAGQKVSFSVDAYPGTTFTGRVESLMAGTGAAFSLLPPENATGNYVKVVQRIPVRIAVDPRPSDSKPLRIGMSVVPAIDTQRGAGAILRDLLP